MKYVVIAKKWFDKINGNSYHSVDIVNVATNKIIYSSGRVYGYDDAYKQTAIKGLIELGLFNEKDIFNHKLINRDLFFVVMENCKKRDLKKQKVV